MLVGGYKQSGGHGTDGDDNGISVEDSENIVQTGPIN